MPERSYKLPRLLVGIMGLEVALRDSLQLVNEFAVDELGSLDNHLVAGTEVMLDGSGRGAGAVGNASDGCTCVAGLDKAIDDGGQQAGASDNRSFLCRR